MSKFATKRRNFLIEPSKAIYLCTDAQTALTQSLKISTAVPNVQATTNCNLQQHTRGKNSVIVLTVLFASLCEAGMEVETTKGRHH